MEARGKRKGKEPVMEGQQRTSAPYKRRTKESQHSEGKERRKGNAVMEARGKRKGKEPVMEGQQRTSAPYKRRTKESQHSEGREQFVSVVDEEMLYKLEQKLERKMDAIARKMDDSVRKTVYQSMEDLRASIFQALKDAGKSTYLSQTPAELGCEVKERADVKEDCVPQPVDDSTANRIWGNRAMWEQLSTDPKHQILEEDFNKILEKVKWDMCLQKMSFTGHEREELSEQKQLDYTMYVKDKERLPSNVTALLSLFSSPDPGKKSKKGKYNSKAQVGHAIRRAITVLQSAGPSRSKIVVGVTNLRCVQWYTVEKAGSEDDDGLRGPFLYSRTPEIDATKRSLAAIFLADPAHMYCDLTKKYFVNSSTVEFVEFLGSGATSSVYKASHLGDTVAAKLFKKGFWANDEIEILKLLGGVQGVPIIKGFAQDLKLLLLSPVGKKLRKSMPVEARINLTGIIDILKEAHQRHIVHRDVRTGNILLVDTSFMLIDWGFACKVGGISRFQGSLLTASSRVLESHGHPIAYQPQDDLISFVKSLYLFSHEGLAYQMRHLGLKQAETSGSGCLMLDPTKINSIWKQLLDVASAWQEALKFAEKLLYDELKNWVYWWALNFCPLKL